VNRSAGRAIFRPLPDDSHSWLMAMSCWTGC
jgi:hypothetical protein